MKRTTVCLLLFALPVNCRYRSAKGENKGFLLLHGTGSKPANSEIDVPLNHADYYLEALLPSTGKALEAAVMEALHL